MFNKKFSIFVLIISIVMMCLSSVSAADDNQFNSTAGIVVDEQNSFCDDVNVADNSSICGAADFADLQNDIQNLHSGDTFDVNKDYFFNKNDTVLYSRVIEINCSNVIINGNGHVIDAGVASEGFSIFKVNGDNVKIFDLTFVNSQSNGDAVFQDIDSQPDGKADSYQFADSPVSWYGDNGVLCNCNFYENTAVNGGALSWRGNNGTIKNCRFINNTADCVGGAIYMTGVNNTINKVIFINSTSRLSGESIFLDRKHNNTKIINTTTNGNRLWTNNALYNIDINNLMESHYSLVGDKQIDLIPIIYQTIMGGIITIPEDNLYCYCQYVGNENFTLTVIRNFEEYDILYQKDYLFTNTTINNIFTSALNDDFKNEILITKTINVTYCLKDLSSFDFIKRILQNFNNENLYEDICSSTADDLIINTPVMGLIAPDLSELFLDTLQHLFKGFGLHLSHNSTAVPLKDMLMFIDIKYGLNVIFPENKVFYSNEKWKTDNGFDIVNIIGNGAKIHATSKDRDEHKFIKPAKDQIYMISNLTVEGFNTAVENNEGYCIFNNVSFINNRMDYWIDRDWGAAIFNLGVCICSNCHFESNYAKNGGAIFNQGYLVLDNCSFKNNKAYGKGNNVCTANGGIVFLDGEQVNKTNDYVTCVKSMSTGLKAFLTAGSIVLSYSVGILATAFTGNLAVGIVAGGLVGAVAGLGSSAIIVAFSYDAKMNRLSLVLSLTGACVVAGMLGGVMGGGLCEPGAELELDAGVIAEGDSGFVSFVDAPVSESGFLDEGLSFESGFGSV